MTIKQYTSVSLKLKDIMDAVSAEYRLPPKEILGTGKTAYVSSARHALMYFSYRFTKFSTVELGKAMGRDHTTIIHGCKKVKTKIDECDKIKSLEQLFSGQIKKYEKEYKQMKRLPFDFSFQDLTDKLTKEIC